MPRFKLNLAGGFFKELWPFEHGSALSKLYFFANFSLQVRILLFNLRARSSSPECWSKQRVTVSPPRNLNLEGSFQTVNNFWLGCAWR